MKLTKYDSAKFEHRDLYVTAMPNDFARGMDFYNGGKINEASACFVKAVQSLGNVYDATIRKQRAECLNMMGVCEMFRHRFGTAFDLFFEATQLVSNESNYWMHFAQACARLGLKELAILYGQKAIEIDKNSFKAYQGLGFTYKEQKKYPEAIICFSDAYNLHQSSTSAFYVADIYQWAGDDDKALEWYDEAFRLDKNNYDAHFAITFLYMKLWWKRNDSKYLNDAKRHAQLGCKSEINGDLSRYNLSLIELTLDPQSKSGWANHEYRLKFKESSSDSAIVASRFKQPVWGGEPGKLFVHTEQGFGDTIQFCRYLNHIKNDYVFEVPRSLYELMKFNFKNVIIRPDDYPNADRTIEFDYHIPLMSFPNATREFPSECYLTAPTEKIEKFKHVRNLKGLKVGICWAGEKRTYDDILAKIDDRRSVSYETFKPIIDVEGVSFVSLQMNKQIDDLRINIIEGITDWSDTAGIIEQLDLVISVDTAVMHLAAAMGKPVRMLNRFDTCWRWGLSGDSSFWYPTMTMFRQKTHGDWDDVVKRIVEELKITAGKVSP